MSNSTNVFCGNVWVAEFDTSVDKEWLEEFCNLTKDELKTITFVSEYELEDGNHFVNILPEPDEDLLSAVLEKLEDY